MPKARTVTAAWNTACPKCEDDSQNDIAAIVHARLCIDGADATAARRGDHEWDDTSQATCCACGHVGALAAIEKFIAK